MMMGRYAASSGFLGKTKKPAGAPTDFVQGSLVHRKQIAQLWFPTDSGGDVIPVPIPQPYLGAEFGGFAPTAIQARRLPQLLRIRNLYRVGKKIPQFFDAFKYKNTQNIYPLYDQVCAIGVQQKQDKGRPSVLGRL